MRYNYRKLPLVHENRMRRPLAPSRRDQQGSRSGSFRATSRHDPRKKGHFLNQIGDLHHVSSHQTPSNANDLRNGFDAYMKQNKSFARYVCYAMRTLHEYDLAVPNVDRITMIVQSALAAQSLFFAASLHHPGHAELHLVFETFVLNCVMPPERQGYP
jgi:hypothetical protein